MVRMYSFQLNNGDCWYLEADDSTAESVLDGMAEIMRLSTVSAGRGSRDPLRTVRVVGAPPDPQPEGISCVLPQPKTPEEVPFIHYAVISQALAWGLLQDGGMLLHGALAEFRPQETAGRGVIFSAYGGAGKTTASRRLPAPWLSLSDDATLVMPAGTGRYQAHPWPTWSSFLYDRTFFGTWDVQASVPLHACVFLQRAPQDSLEPLGAGQAASLLAESARQINFGDRKLPPEESRQIRLRRFDALCGLVKSVPAHLLHISRNGEFWREVEGILI
jgi:SynChlorMet cassette protein ScmC